MKRRTTLVAAALILALTPAYATAQQWEYYHLDALGSVRAITDEDGKVIARYDYEPFGEEWNGTASANSRRFTGKERDQESGFDYFGARYYGPEIGRFTSIDPVYTWSENLADPQRWNRYAYVRNNPLRFSDPDGREIMEIPLGNGQFLSLASGQVHAATPLTTTELKLIGAVLNTTNFGEWVELAYEGSEDRSALLLRAKDSLSPDEIAMAEDVVGMAMMVRGGGRSGVRPGPRGGGGGRSGLRPGQKTGGSGKAISPTVKHPSRKRALDAAQAETAKGQAPSHHRAKGDAPPHFHSVNSKGEIQPKHHDYPPR